MDASNRTKHSLKYFFLGCATALLLFSMFALAVVRHQRGERDPQAMVGDSDAAPQKVPPGGWIEAEQIPLSDPDGVLPDGNERLRPPKWFFEGFTARRLVRFLNSCELRPSQRRILLSPKNCNIMTNGCEITPPDSLIWSLNSRARQQIYSALGRVHTNYAQRFPLRFSAGEFENRLEDSGLNDRDLDKVRQLVYTNSGTICFTDLDAIRDVLPADRFDNLIEAFYEIPAYSLRLHVAPDSDITALVSYWGKGGRERLIRPLLKALTKVPGGAAINVNYLMPPFARLRLYTYPDSWNDPTTARQDCFFTAMNFFNETPNTNFFDSAYCQKVLDQDYSPATDDPVYGDVIVLLDGAGQAIHTCVYIVDEFVFTKNGMNRAQPWVVMRMSDMMPIYFGPDKSGRVLVLRKKTAVESPRT